MQQQTPTCYSIKPKPVRAKVGHYFHDVLNFGSASELMNCFLPLVLMIRVSQFSIVGFGGCFSIRFAIASETRDVNLA